MMKIITRFFAIMILCALISTSGIAQVKYTNQTADMRTGPAAYYDLLLRLYMNNRVELDSTQGYWDKIRFKGTNGWVPSYTLSDQRIDSEALKSDSLQQRMNLMFSQLNNEGEATPEDLVASAAQVSAAVKGFAEKYRKARGIDYTVDLEKFLIDPPSAIEFSSFIGVRSRELPRMQRRKLLYPGITFIPFPDPAIDQIGYAVATVVAQEGLISNYQLQRYLDLLSGLIVENSHRPELDVSVFILDEEEVQGYSLPGNFIFVSKGAIKAMNTEAELVHFLSHEVAHLVFSHGMLEYHEREEKIKAESMFDELRAKIDDEDPNEELRTMEQKLTDYANEMYDYVYKDRLAEYEVTADSWANVYTYLSGYNPHQAIKYLNRIQISETEARMEWNGLALENRIKAISADIRRLAPSGNVNSELFNRLKEGL